jgi:hypothetical protein
LGEVHRLAPAVIEQKSEPDPATQNEETEIGAPGNETQLQQLFHNSFYRGLFSA